MDLREAILRSTDETLERWETQAIIALRAKPQECPSPPGALKMLLILVAATGNNSHAGAERYMHLGDDAQITKDGIIISRFYRNGEDHGVGPVCSEADLNRALAWLMKELDASQELYDKIRAKVAAWFSRDERNIGAHQESMRETLR